MYISRKILPSPPTSTNITFVSSVVHVIYKKKTANRPKKNPLYT